MRLLTGTDIIDFHNGRDDLLVLDADGEFTTLNYSDVASSPYQDNRATAYDRITTEDGDRVQVLLERSTIDEGEWFPDALNEDGDLNASAADDMASIINSDADLHTTLAVTEVREATSAWEEATAEADRRAVARAHAILNVVTRCGGNQSHAARILGLDQSTVNKLVRKARAQAAHQ